MATAQRSQGAGVHSVHAFSAARASSSAMSAFVSSLQTDVLFGILQSTKERRKNEQTTRDSEPRRRACHETLSIPLASMDNVRMLRGSLIVIGTVAIVCCISLPQTQATHANDKQEYKPTIARSRVTSMLDCGEAQLKNFVAEVRDLKRQAYQATFKVKLDSGETREIVMQHPQESLTRRFLIAGQPFKRQHWAHVQASRKRIRPGLKATFWS
jgi:hypothetical protein